MPCGGVGGVEVPLTSSLKALHEVIQAVMLFENHHLFQFYIGKRVENAITVSPTLTAGS